MSGDTPSGPENLLARCLDHFASAHAGARVSSASLDVTDAFYSPDAQGHVAPRSFGQLPATRVMGYVVRGAALVTKYLRDGNGQLRRDSNGHPLLAPFGPVQQTMACLCVLDIRNTSLLEISDALSGSHRVQGFRRWHVHRLARAAAGVEGGFDPERDSLFLFAGAPAMLEARIAVNALWLEAILDHGAAAPGIMSQEEHFWMARAFPSDVLRGCPEAIRRRSYMWGRELWQPQSAEFLAGKAAAWRAFSRQLGMRA